MARVEGRNPVIELLKGSRKIEKIYLQSGIKGKVIDLITRQAAGRGIPLQRVKKQQLDQLASSHAHQGVVAYAEDVKLVSVREIINFARDKQEDPFVLILDQIQDPQNFGSMIRTAYAAGLHGIIFPKDRASGITPTVIKASAGAVDHIRLAEVTNINQVIQQLKEEGLWIAGTDVDSEKLHYQTDLRGPLGVVVGNEGAGMRRLVKENCDFLIKIPMSGELGSLNASVATGVIIYEIVRQRASSDMA